MKKNKYTKNSSDNSSSTDARESYIKSWELSLAELEKIGALLTSYGYLTFFFAANLDSLTILDMNNTGYSAEEFFVYGQSLSAIGYSILWIVSMNRYSEAVFKFNTTDETPDLAAFDQLKTSYLISLFANFYRLDAFIKLYKDSVNEANASEKNTQETEINFDIF